MWLFNTFCIVRHGVLVSKVWLGKAFRSTDSTQREEDMQEETNELKEQLLAHAEVRRAYIIEQRPDENPLNNQGLLLAIEAPEATKDQWDDLIELIIASPVRFASEPIWMEKVDAPVREHVLRYGALIVDKNNSPTSPT